MLLIAIFFSNGSLSMCDVHTPYPTVTLLFPLMELWSPLSGSLSSDLSPSDLPMVIHLLVGTLSSVMFSLHLGHSLLLRLPPSCSIVSSSPLSTLPFSLQNVTHKQPSSFLQEIGWLVATHQNMSALVSNKGEIPRVTGKNALGGLHFLPVLHMAAHRANITHISHSGLHHGKTHSLRCFKLETEGPVDRRHRGTDLTVVEQTLNRRQSPNKTSLLKPLLASYTIIMSLTLTHHTLSKNILPPRMQKSY
ncbi:hypothetical protein VNO78_26860 [Psophocarpus tetragonolobus]|uniref:Uncharacterized protein n=1 Tax=Psophocarpus tetragonolobus TaxID=3891 RepID=A0AAN9S2F6_PSOTE